MDLLPAALIIVGVSIFFIIATQVLASDYWLLPSTEEVLVSDSDVEGGREGDSVAKGVDSEGSEGGVQSEDDAASEDELTSEAEGVVLISLFEE